MNSKKTHKVTPCKLSLTVQYASDARNLPARAQLRRWVNSALQRDVSMTLRIVDEAEGRKLNQSYRGKNYATNVSYDYGGRLQAAWLER
jgi:probable rRNA maturation factor